MDSDQKYSAQLHQSVNTEIEEPRVYVEESQVPTVDKLALDLIKRPIRMNKTRNILEIDTTIGYSSMQFANVSKDINIATIERNEDVIHFAKKFIKKYRYQNQIRLVEYDALNAFEQVDDKQYNMIFIDAVKTQSMKFFQLCAPLSRKGGVVVTNGVLYRGFVSNINVARSRNVKQMAKKVQQYNGWLMKQSQFTTNFINMDDGLAISIRGGWLWLSY